jgi:hypothetical protein
MPVEFSYATQEDNLSLIRLFNKYPESSGFKYILDRSPDYFAFCNLHDNWKVIVAKERQLVGAVTLTFSDIFIGENIQNIAYISDLRVDLPYRGQRIGNNLLKEAIANSKNIPVFASVFKDNSAGLKAFADLSKDNTAHFQKAVDILAYFILPVNLKKLSPKVAKYTVRTASEKDLAEMADLWNQVNTKKNMAGVFNHENLSKWFNKVPELSINSFLVAVDKNNKIKAFLGLWNQSELRRISITSETNFIKFIRISWNLLKKVTGFNSFPVPGETLNFYNVFNLCIEHNEAELLPLLLAHAFKIVKNNNALFLALALDKNDPLNKQLKGYISSTSEIVLLSTFDFNNISTHKKHLFHLEISL